MSPHIAMLRVAIALALIASTPVHADDVTVQPAAGSGFVVTNAGGTQLRLRVDENGNIVIPVLVNGAQQNLPVCVGSGGQIGPCAPGSGGSGSNYTAATGLTLSGTEFSVAPTYQLPQSCTANQVPQWSGTAWGCIALPSGGSAFMLPYAGSTSSAAAAFAITSSGGDGLNGFTNQAGNSGVYGNNSGGGKGVFGVSGSGNGVEGGSTSGSGLKGSTAGASGQAGAAGVWGDSHDFYGVWGTSATADGTNGHSESTTGGVGVRGTGKGATWGVVGSSDTGNGVFGSSTGAGVWGESSGYDAIHGHTSNSAGNTSGVAGFGDGNNNGVAGISTNGSGVFGISGGAGVWGESIGGSDGVHGHVNYGESYGGSGVAGFGDKNSRGVTGSSQSGIGVFGHSDSGYGMSTDGPAQQARNQGGWVKAMALIDDGGTGTIVRCFNSQLPANQASVPPCGFRLSTSPGFTTSGPWVDGAPWVGNIDMGFEVDDRFILVTPLQINASATPTVAQVFNMSGNVVSVSTWDSSGNGVEAQFFIVVY